MKSTKTKNTVETAYDFILENIIHRNLRPGEVVTENSLSEKFELGRTPIREALKKLEMEGLIVTENRTKKVYYLSPEDLEDIFNIKIVLESAIAGWAAKNTNVELQEKLSTIMLNMKELGKGGLIENDHENALLTWLSLDNQFHDVLDEMAGNKKAFPIIKTLNIQWHRLKVGITAIEGRIEKAINEHCIIGNAVLNNNPAQAVEEMTKHLESLKEIILKMMRTFG
jgi:DNA-binding GntR family transcriptional regulator